MELSSARRGSSAQWAEEMVREQQQKLDGEDVVMQERGMVRLRSVMRQV